MSAVASELSKAWIGKSCSIYHIGEYYNNPRVAKWIREQGYKEVDEGYHDNLQYTAQMMVFDPTTVRMKQRLAAGKFSINGVGLSPPQSTIAFGKRLIGYQADITAAAIREARGY